MPGKDNLKSLVDVKNLKNEFDFVVDGLYLIKDTITELNKYELFGKSGKSVKDVTLATRDLAKELANAKKLNEQLVKQQQKENEARKNSTKLTIEEKEALRQKNAEAKREAQINLAAANSGEKAIALRAKLRAEVLKTDITNVERIKVLNDRIDKLSAIEARIADKRKAQSLNVGNYEGSAKIIVEALQRIKVKQEEVNKKFGEGSPEANNLRTQYEALSRVVDNPQFLNVSAKFGDTTRELKFFTKQLNVLEDAGQKNSQVYKDIQKRLATLTDQLNDTRQEIKAMSSDTRGFDLFAGAVNFAADSFQTLAGAATLFGASEEDAAEATRTLIAVQSVSNGIKGIANELTTKGTLANKAYSLIQAQVAIVTNASAAATARFAAALRLTGIGALVLGLGALAFKLFSVKTNADKTGESLRNLAGDLAFLDTQVANSLKAVENANRKRISDLKGIGVNQETINKAMIEGLQTEKDYLETAKEKNIALINSSGAYNTTIKSVAQLSKEVSIAKAILAGEDLSERSKARYESFVKNGEAVLAIENKIIDKDLEINDIRNNISAERIQKGKEAAEKSAEDAKAAAEKALQVELDAEQRKNIALAEIRKEKLNAGIDKNDAIAEDVEQELSIRINSAKIVAALRKKLALEEYIEATQDEKELQDGKIVILKKSAEEKELALLQYNNKINAINVEQGKREIDITKQASDKLFEEREKRYNDSIRDAQTLQELNSADIQNQYDRKMLLLDRKLKAGKIKEEKYNKEKIKLQQKLSYDLLKEDIAFTKKVLDLAEARAKVNGDKEALDGVLKQKRKLAAEEIKLDRLTLDSSKDIAKEKLENLEKVFNKIKSIAQNVFDIVGGFVNASVEREKNAIQQQIDELEKKKEKDIEVAEQTIGNAAIKADTIAAIEQKAQAKKDVLEIKQRQAEERKARFEKAATIAKIILDTASAVIAQLKIPGNLAGAIAVGALGAAQLAVAIATPIPKYKYGTDNHPGGLMIVGDGGKHEGIITPDGKVFKTPKVPTIMWGESGTKVDPDFYSMNLSNVPDIKVDAPYNSEIALKKLGDRVVKAISNKTEMHLTGIPKHKLYLKTGHVFRTYLNERL